MPRIARKISAMATKTTHAPDVNRLTVAITRTVPVSTAPSRLMARERRIRLRSRSVGDVSRRARFQCRTMPLWPRVKEMKTPMM